MVVSLLLALNGQKVQRIPGDPINMGTWNVQRFYQTGKVHDTTWEMQRMDILGVRYGVAIIVKKDMKQYVLNLFTSSNRVIMIQLKIHTGNINTIQAYATTADDSDDEIGEFDSQLNSLSKISKHTEIHYSRGF